MPNNTRRSHQSQTIPRSSGGTTVVVIGGDEILTSYDSVNRIEVAPDQTVVDAIATVVADTHPDPTEEAAAGILVKDFTIHDDPTELVVIVVTATEDVAHPDPSAEQALITHVDELYAAGTDLNSLVIVVDETHNTPIEDVLLLIYQTEETTHPDATDLNAVGTIIAESQTQATDENYLDINYDAWPDTVESNSNWNNDANMTDKDENTNAALNATSSGIVPGTTSNTTNGTLVVSVDATDVSDLTIDSVTLESRSRVFVSGGTPLTGQAANMSWEYSVDDGSNWTNYLTKTTVGDGADTISLDITSVINGDWNKVEQFRFRATGSVTSGTGIASNVTVQAAWWYARLAITASKTY